MIVEDFVCLGRTVPEESKKYGHKVCMAGYSFELGSFLRVYPLPVQNSLRANYSYVLSLARNSSDSRKESWRLTDRIALYESSSRVSDSDLRSLVVSNTSESIAQLNQDRRSIGIVRASDIAGEFELRKNCGTTQMELFESCDRAFGANAIPAAPYVRFNAGSKSHRLQIREWGCYEWIRKNPANCSALFQNLKLRSDRDVFFLIGNMANHRNVWLIIKSYSFEKTTQVALF